MKRMTSKRVLPWLVTLGFFAIWQLFCVAFKIDRFVLPAPSEVAISLATYTGPIMVNAMQTLMSTLIGFAIAVAFGLVLGLVVGASRTVYDGLYPVMIGFNSI